MKIAWVTDAWPPRDEAAHGEHARACAAADGEVVVVCGSNGTNERATGDAGAAQDARVSNDDGATPPGDVRVLRIRRSDLYPEHWQKSASASASASFRALLRRERPDVVHVHHWRGLSRDLVHTAALAGIPAVVSLHDPWTTCLIDTRVQPGVAGTCTAPIAARPCLACAGGAVLPTPWVPREAQYMALAERQADIVRELALARAVLVRTSEHGDLVRRYLGEAASQLAPFFVASAGPESSAAVRAVYTRAIALGAPRLAAAPNADWFTQRMKTFAESEWDRLAALHAHESPTRTDAPPPAGGVHVDPA